VEGQKEAGVRKAEWIIRACQDRGLIVDKGATAGCPTRLRAQVASTPILGHLTVDVRERVPKSKDDRKRKQARDARTADLTVQAARVRLRAADRAGDKLPNIEVNCVLVTELNTPEGVEPIEWLLLTSLPVDTIEQVLTITSRRTTRAARGDPVAHLPNCDDVPSSMQQVSSQPRSLHFGFGGGHTGNRLRVVTDDKGVALGWFLRAPSGRRGRQSSMLSWISSELPRSSGAYIAWARAGSAWKRPGISARRR
jgi:hypothetical protein